MGKKIHGNGILVEYNENSSDKERKKYLNLVDIFEGFGEDMEINLNKRQNVTNMTLFRSMLFEVV